MQTFRTIAVVFAAALLSACGSSSKFQSYHGPEVTQVVVDKGQRRMFLMHHDRVLKHYPVKLGFAPTGHKQIEGDGRTPEGHYVIDRRNPNSKYHLSIGIDYPNRRDMALAEALGKDPGGNIFIHGGPPRGAKIDGKTDWTWGCIAITDRQIEEVYAMVRNGTPIYIAPADLRQRARRRADRS